MKKYSLVFLIIFLSSCYNSNDFKNESNEKEETQRDIEQSSDNLTEVINTNTFTSKVIGIQDGDTIELQAVYTGKDAKERQGRNLRIRFAHIDTPERGQPFYKIAKQFTAESCFGEIVTIKHEGKFDRYGRLIGEIILLNGQNLNKELVKNGLAIHFKKFSDSEEYNDLEIQAKVAQKGIWSE
jgi:micrococcal nuclease